MQRPRIVLADDNQAIVESIRQLLVSDFDVVAVVSDGQAAFDAIVALRPDVVVLDISMPFLNGLEVATRLSATTDPPRIVFFTVHEGSEFLAAAREAGASGYVFKRNACSDLVRVLHQTLAGDRAFQELRVEAKLIPD